jgi:rhodanese-related sulfurtransferase
MAVNKYFAEMPDHIYKIGQKDFVQMAKDDADMYVIDIRTAEDYAKGHIAGAVNMPWGTAISDNLMNIPTDKDVYIYCYSGQTAGQTVALMNMLGIEAYSIKSGFNKGAATIDGYGAYTTTDVTELVDAGAEFDNVLLTEVKAYFNAVLDSANFKIGLEDAKAAVEAKEATVIDIRKAEDFAAGHIEGAINVPFGENMQEKFADLPDGKLIVACYSGQTAGQTTAVLRMLGHDAVSLHFGMKVGWIKEGYPVVTD